MTARITYIFHNCFVLELGGKTFLFDYPDADHRNDLAEHLVLEKVEGADLTVFISHSHDDHFTPEVIEMGRKASSVRYLVSYDVADLHPEFTPKEEGGKLDVTVLEPQDEDVVEEKGRSHDALLVDDMSITVYESTDLGIGALIVTPHGSIYYGGDVAGWDWENLDNRTRAFSRAAYQSVLQDLSGRHIDIAFSNTDKRLANWSGALDFVNQVRPHAFVPMHVFGKTEWVWEFAGEIGDCQSKIFLYAGSGDAMEVSI